MPKSLLIFNDRQARDASARMQQIDQALSSDQVLKSIADGLPHVVTEGVCRSLSVERNELVNALSAYQDAKGGKPDKLIERAGKDPGSLLIVARITRDWSQKDLARRVFLPEQQIQRYESERYRSISLSGLTRVGKALGVQVTADLANSIEKTWLPNYEMSAVQAQKILNHARTHGWLERTDGSDESGVSQIKRTIDEHVGEYGTPSLLRTGLNVRHVLDDWLLLSWKAQVTRKVLTATQISRVKYRPQNFTWLQKLVKLSAFEDGPLRAIDFLAEQGISVVIEPHIPSLILDGAAFLINDIPVIGLTLLRDRLDNFWFTLLHEVGHVVLHVYTGLASGFFDDEEKTSLDELEIEANQFASNMLVPEEVWVTSPARITKSPDPVIRLADQLGISPTIIFGRIRRERQNYTVFSDKLGNGRVRAMFPRQFNLGEATHEQTRSDILFSYSKTERRRT